MKTSAHRIASGGLVVSLFVAFARADSLDPAGPPGSDITRMPTLNQIEPRQVIESLPFTISNSGPYVVTRNLTGASGFSGITIQTNSVTLDLNGFALTGVAGSVDGIVVQSGRAFIVVKNGVVSGWGQDGINAECANDSKIEDLLISGNARHGVSLGTNGMVVRCKANSNGTHGFMIGSDCTILDSTAKGNGGTGFSAASGCVIQRCLAGNNAAYGFDVEALGQIAFCTASGNGNNGFNLQHNSSVLDSCASGNFEGFHGWDGIVFSRCVAYSNRFGFYAAKNGSVSDCSAYGNVYCGVYGDQGCTIANCTAYGNNDGLGASGGSKISDSSAYMNRNSGFWLGPASSVQGCSAADNVLGVAAQRGCYVSDNEFSGNTGAGILASIKCRIEDNHVTDCATGMVLTGTANILTGNTLLNNATDYQMGAGNSLDLLVAEIPTVIAWPAKVAVAGPLTGITSANGITITSSDVSVDLGGHALLGVPGSFNGISVLPDCNNVEIKNGAISHWGHWGINGGSASLMKVTGIRAFTNGTSSAYGGLCVGGNSVVRDCQTVANRGVGLSLQGGSTATDCLSNNNGNDGIQVDSGCTVSACSCRANGDDGIQPFGTNNTIEANTLTLNAWAGIYDVTGDNLIIRNRASGNRVTNFTM